MYQIAIYNIGIKINLIIKQKQNKNTIKKKKITIIKIISLKE